MKKNNLKIIIGLLLYLLLPIVFAYIIVKLYVKGNGTVLTIIFFTLIGLSLATSIYKFIKYNKNNNR